MHGTKGDVENRFYCSVFMHVLYTVHVCTVYNTYVYVYYVTIMTL